VFKGMVRGERVHYIPPPALLPFLMKRIPPSLSLSLLEYTPVSTFGIYRERIEIWKEDQVGKEHLTLVSLMSLEFWVRFKVRG
jgi:hypothetical protein